MIKRKNKKKFNISGDNFKKNPIKAGMIVEVIAGNFKKQQGKVLRFNRKIGYAIVEGINTKKRTLKTNQNKKIQIEKESYIHVSNLKKIGEDNATI